MMSLLLVYLSIASALYGDAFADKISRAATPLAAFLSDRNNAVRVWSDNFGTAGKDFICYEPSLPSAGWAVLGQRGQQNHDPLSEPIMAMKELESGSLARAVSFEFLWDDRFGTNLFDASLWRPGCPSGYVALGDIFYPANRITAPDEELYEKFRCVRADLTEICYVGDKVWDDGGSTSWYDVSVWEPLPGPDAVEGYLYGNNEHAYPPRIQMRCLLDSAYAVVYDV